MLDESAPVAVHVTPPHLFAPIDGKLNIAFCAWEHSELSPLFNRLEDADILLLTASFLLDPFQARFPDKDIRLCHLGVDGDTFGYLDRSTTKMRPNFRPANRSNGCPLRFLWVGAPNSRKGPFHVLQAWRAFQEHAGLELYVKTTVQPGSKSAQGLRRIGNIIWDDRKLPLGDLVKLYHDAHCFLFPTCAEGFGLSAAEAMATGLPMVYTPTTALLDLAPPSEQIGYPIKFGWHEYFDEHYQADVRVAAPDAFDMGTQMVDVINQPAEAFRRGKLAAERIRRLFTWQACGIRLRAAVEDAYGRIESYQSQGGGNGEATPIDARTTDGAHVRAATRDAGD